MELKHIHDKPNLLPAQPTRAKTAVKCMRTSFVCCFLFNYAHSFFVLASLKIQFCGEASSVLLTNILAPSLLLSQAAHTDAFYKLSGIHV